MIEVPEHGEAACALAPPDVAHIQAVAAGTSGVVFPEPAKRKKPLIHVSHTRMGGVTVRTGGVVGIIPLPSGEVLRITPKVGSRDGVFWLLCHALGFNDIRLLSRLENVDTRKDPVEWLFLALRHEVRKLAQGGLRKDYVPVEETAGVVRGRILPARTIAETRGLTHKVTCLYDDFTPDVFDNQVLRLALRAAARHAPNLRHQLLGTDALFDGEVTCERSDIRRAADELKRLLDQQHPGRKRYFPAHTLAYMVLRILSVGGDGRAWRQPGILLNMDRLFEDALRSILKPLGDSSFNHELRFERNVRLSMKPDIPLRGLIVDAKYKRTPLHKRKSDREPELPLSGDIYQAYAYSSFGKRPCALVYAVGDKTNESIRAKLAAPGCPQTDAEESPRVGLFSLNISGTTFGQLTLESDRLISQLKQFASGVA